VNGVTGVIVPPRDSSAIVDAVIHLVANPEIAKTIRLKGPLHVRKSFPWQRMIAEEIDCLALHTKTK
jgi:glycosyltransferase involved in cell wall biosynthesis